jgi:adenylate cyclase
MRLVSRRWTRILITLLPLAFALLHATGTLRLGVLQTLDSVIYDARLRATMPATLDPRIVIVDIDEKSLAEFGRWPWSRNKLAALVDELHDRQGAALLGFDVVFAEPDESSGLKNLTRLADTEFANQPGFRDKVRELEPSLNYDALFAESLKRRPVVLGYYLTSDREGRASGVLPPPAMEPGALQGRDIAFINWTGYGANIEPLARAASGGGFFNSITDADGVVRSLPLIAEYQGQYYESLALAMLRRLLGQPRIEPGFATENWFGRDRASEYRRLESILLKDGKHAVSIPVDHQVAALVPFRGKAGPGGGSFQYISAADVLAKRQPAGSLANKIVLIGTTAPGLLDLRVTPIGETYPGVEVQANALSGLLDGKVLARPDYAVGFEVILLVLAGITLAAVLPRLSAIGAVAAGAAVVLAIVAINLGLYLGRGLVLPMASALVMTFIAFALNMSYGFFVESRARRRLANLFGTYVPPELAEEMMKHPYSYSMQAETRELTVMFCDMRGFTQLSESMEPLQLQALLNRVFSRLTEVIRAHRGTIDKYMGDCVMAFWGAPVRAPDHAELAVQAALGMAAAMRELNDEQRALGLPAIGIGVGLNTGFMCVGDMGSDVRRSYTVIGDAVNLACRLEALARPYGVDIVASEFTHQQAGNVIWQELDTVRVKGRDGAVTIFSPQTPAPGFKQTVAHELETWKLMLKAYKKQDWTQCDAQLAELKRINAEKCLYALYAERVASRKGLPFDPAWDATTSFATK